MCELVSWTLLFLIAVTVLHLPFAFLRSLYRRILEYFMVRKDPIIEFLSPFGVL